MGQTIPFLSGFLGAFKIKLTDIREIAAGSGRYLVITSVPPMGETAISGTNADDPIRVQPATDPGAPDILLTRANFPVSYAVPLGLTVFTSSVSIPKDAPAGTRFTFAVYGDGKFLIQRSLPMAVGDPPQALRAELNNVHAITLRAEPSFPGMDKVYGQWTGPMLFHP